MRCVCCDKILNDFEATRKSIRTGEYLDMCSKCYSTIDKTVLSYERYDLKDEDEQDSWDDMESSDTFLDIPIDPRN